MVSFVNSFSSKPVIANGQERLDNNNSFIGTSVHLHLFVRNEPSVFRLFLTVPRGAGGLRVHGPPNGGGEYLSPRDCGRNGGILRGPSGAGRDRPGGHGDEGVCAAERTVGVRVLPVVGAACREDLDEPEQSA